MKNHATHLLQEKVMEDFSSPLSAQFFELYDPELFPEALQNSEVTSSPNNCCYEENSSYATTNLPFDPDINNPPNNTIEKNVTTSSATTTININNLSRIFDSTEEIDQNDISASINFTPSTPFLVPPFLISQEDQFDLSSLQSQTSLSETAPHGLSQYPSEPVIVPLMGPPLPSVFEEECLSLMPSYMPLSSSSPPCSFIEHSIGPHLSGNLSTVLSGDSSGVFSGSMYNCSDLQSQELEFEGDIDGGIFCPDTLPRIYNPSELQALSNESQQGVNGGGSSTPLASDISSLEDSTFKYACRKTLADSRPRVRGRFAKNDEFCETPREGGYSNHEEDTDEDVVVKEEEYMVDSSDIFAHISGVNSFKCNYSIQSWI
ncbi:hypothetical protein TEA_028920 [Camellia sinensis var. sinensis]|uniref:CCT domain-containing protein n=1 Tax=Camellia sinensis var. sinensis TaxID=542762 RepID=A0A4S4EHQ0_CAMSN|nr:hypothetical protein TEA_028920 [Camellia sinensis var. sinensis]